MVAHKYKCLVNNDKFIQSTVKTYFVVALRVFRDFGMSTDLPAGKPSLIEMFMRFSLCATDKTVCFCLKELNFTIIGQFFFCLNLSGR